MKAYGDFFKLLLSMELLVIMVACEHKDLCYDHASHAPRYTTDIEISYDCSWEYAHDGMTNWAADWPDNFGRKYDDMRPGIPDGMRVVSYDMNGKQQISNISPTGEEVFLFPDENSLLIYNNDTEYIIFNAMESYATASATTRSRSRGSYKGNPLYTPVNSTVSRAEETYNMPDILYCKYIESYFQERSSLANHLSVVVRPLVFSYLVRYEFKHGLNYVALARGALSGMAESVSLHDGHTSRTPATLLYDCSIESWGAEAIITSFGIPDFPNPSYSRSDYNFAINLEVRLHNGKILNFYYDVSEQVLSQPHGGVIVIPEIEISDKDGNLGGGAFDVEVEGWGEYEDVEIIL